jgi:prepilin-type N-terminal cleavage/methylation domain-containing protein
MKTDAAGFTITEVLITLAVVGVMVSIAMPALNGFVEDGQLNANTNDLLCITAFGPERGGDTKQQSDSVQNRSECTYQL